MENFGQILERILPVHILSFWEAEEFHIWFSAKVYPVKAGEYLCLGENVQLICELWTFPEYIAINVSIWHSESNLFINLLICIYLSLFKISSSLNEASVAVLNTWLSCRSFLFHCRRNFTYNHDNLFGDFYFLAKYFPKPPCRCCPSFTPFVLEVCICPET